eukprot:1137688-Pelagomonas_calceolata.AAC.4
MAMASTTGQSARNDSAILAVNITRARTEPWQGESARALEQAVKEGRSHSALQNLQISTRVLQISTKGLAGCCTTNSTHVRWQRPHCWKHKAFTKVHEC